MDEERYKKLREKYHFQNYEHKALVKIKKKVKKLIAKGETDYWGSVKQSVLKKGTLNWHTRESLDNDPSLKDYKDITDDDYNLVYDFHILLTEDFDTCKERYEIDVYAVFKNSEGQFETNLSDLVHQYHVPYDPKVFPEKAEENDLKEYRVQIVLEEGSVVYVKAKDEEEAEKLAYDIADGYAGSSYPDEYGSKCVHREFFTQQAEEVK